MTTTTTTTIPAWTRSLAVQWLETEYVNTLRMQWWQRIEDGEAHPRRMFQILNDHDQDVWCSLCDGTACRDECCRPNATLYPGPGDNDPADPWVWL